ncbi:hypothetical protein Taro_005920 [Colocasia esculenta]|uniref:CBM20 domain-containing protein n=1 Tax=Colocasia esculenta TaxID=4460 RepID=A0A843TVN9_COLES|nr:hypothetical protein [Colocasia esculenta]
MIWLLDEPRTVRVRFMLQKSCQFGEHFLVVGEHRALGSWNPEKALPLEWSDGHIWVADDVELPVGEEIKYKFILRSLLGKIKWQPGPDKVLQTCESADAIVVTGDWESEADEKTTEKEKVSEDSTAAGADGEGATESNQAEVAEGNLKNTAEAGEEKPVVHEGEPALIPGLAPLAASPTEVEGKSDEASGESTAGKTDSPPAAAAEVGSSIAENNPFKSFTAAEKDMPTFSATSLAWLLRVLTSRFGSLYKYIKTRLIHTHSSEDLDSATRLPVEGLFTSGTEGTTEAGSDENKIEVKPWHIKMSAYSNAIASYHLINRLNIAVEDRKPMHVDARS